jgi:pyruvate/2-oxoglutarate dehydrogenase complex dihydrolipoamide dehydrogenase (E3) component
MPSRYRKKPLAQLEHGTRIYAPSPQASRGAEAAGRFGIHVGEVATDWSTLPEWVGSVVKHVGSFSPFALEANGIPVLATGARFVGSGHIEAGDGLLWPDGRT